MGILSKRKIRRAIDAAILPRTSAAGGKAEAQALLKRLRIDAVPILIDRLNEAAATDRAPIAEVLASLLDDSTLAEFVSALSSSEQQVVDLLTQLMSDQGRFDANRLLAVFNQETTPKAALTAILTARKGTLREDAIGRLLAGVTAESRVPAFRLLESVATNAHLPHLVAGLDHSDWRVRLSIARSLSSFGSPEAKQALTRLLSDTNKAVRREALDGLAKAGGEIDIGAVTALLRDPDLTIQSRAIEVIITANHPRSMAYLLDVLQDESEYVRRAAVEVLNEIGNASTIKDLLDALRDKDWWVRVRAADALGTIGGPKVVEATLSLLRDEDEFIRRSAIEILNTTKDDRALNALIDALADPDWWVRERAVDALSELGNPEAVPALIRLLDEHPEGSHVIISALIRFEDARTVLPLLRHLDCDREEQTAQILGILSNCAEGDQVEVVLQSLRALLENSNGRIHDLTMQTLESLSNRLGKRHATCAPPSVTSDVRPTQVLSFLDPRDSAQSAVAEDRGSDVPMADPAANQAAATATTTITDPTALAAGTVVGDRYRVIRHIEGGAFGVVVLVEDIVLNEQVILKFLRPHVASDPKVISRFMQELRCARKISHENVIRIHDFLLLGNAYAISMEYFPSRPLSAEIERCGTIEPQRALRIAADTCAGMIVAHGADIVHRDLKPANVLINEDDQVKIVDFGLAAAASYAGTRLTTAGMAVGTPTYMSPEQIRGQEFDARTDIYSLAVILYEMLTGRPPYTGADPISILYQHLEGKFVRPRELVPEIPQTVEALVIKAMATEPAARYQTVLELRQAIEGRLTKGAA